MNEPKARIKVWDVPIRLFHWTLVVSIAVAFLSSEEESASISGMSYRVG